MTGRVASINRSSGGVPKLPVSDAIVCVNGLDSDAQRDRRYHGGPGRAVCLFSLERIAALRLEGHQIVPGATGENITVGGIDWDLVVPGARLEIGEILLEIASYTKPCKTIRHVFLEEKITRMSQKLHPGWSRVYARVLRSGRIATGDQVTLTAPAPPVTLWEGWAQLS